MEFYTDLNSHEIDQRLKTQKYLIDTLIGETNPDREKEIQQIETIKNNLNRYNKSDIKEVDLTMYLVELHKFIDEYPQNFV